MGEERRKWEPAECIEEQQIEGDVDKQPTRVSDHSAKGLSLPGDKHSIFRGRMRSSSVLHVSDTSNTGRWETKGWEKISPTKEQA